MVTLAALFLYRRTRELGVSGFEQRIAARTKEQGGTRGGWLLAVFDNGLVLQGQRQGGLVSFYLCYGPDSRATRRPLASLGNT